MSLTRANLLVGVAAFAVAAVNSSCSGESHPAEILLPTEAAHQAAVLEVGPELVALRLADGVLAGAPVVADAGSPAKARIHLYTRTLEELGFEEGLLSVRPDRRGRPLPTPDDTQVLDGGEWTRDAPYSGRLSEVSVDVPARCAGFSKVRTETFDGRPAALEAVGEPDHWEESFAVVSLRPHVLYAADATRSVRLEPPDVDADICSICTVIATFRGFGDALLFTYVDPAVNVVDGAVWETFVGMDPPRWTPPEIVARPTRDFAVKQTAGARRTPVDFFYVLASEPMEGTDVVNGFVDRLVPNGEPGAVFAFSTEGATVAATRGDLSTWGEAVAAIWIQDGTLAHGRWSLTDRLDLPSASAVEYVSDEILIVGDEAGGLYRVDDDGVSAPVAAPHAGAIEDILRVEGGFVVVDGAGKMRRYRVDGDNIEACPDEATLSAQKDLRVVRVMDDLVVLGETATGAVLDWWRTP